MRREREGAVFVATDERRRSGRRGRRRTFFVHFSMIFKLRRVLKRLVAPLKFANVRVREGSASMRALMPPQLELARKGLRARWKIASKGFFTLVHKI
jgi:hypothetical protein